MRSEEWFALALRVLGVVGLNYGVWNLLDSLLFQLGYFTFPDTSPRYYVVTGLAYLFAGLYLLRGAPLLVRLAYPGVSEKEGEEDINNSGPQDA